MESIDKNLYGYKIGTDSKSQYIVELHIAEPYDRINGTISVYNIVNQSTENKNDSIDTKPIKLFNGVVSNISYRGSAIFVGSIDEVHSLPFRLKFKEVIKKCAFENFEVVKLNSKYLIIEIDNEITIKLYPSVVFQKISEPSNL